ncbi:unnamed protein product [Aphanomyces euteiches]
MSSSTTAAKNDAVAYEINVAKTANQLIDHVVSGSRFAFETNLVWKATVKPCSWYNDVVSLVETSGQVERVNQTKAWKQVTSSPPRSFSALSTSSVPQEEALVRHVVGHSAKDDLVVCVDAFASNCNRAFQQWCNKMTYLTTHYDVARWCHADGNTRQDLLKDLQALNQQDDRRLEQPTLLDFNDSGDDIPDESSLIRFLARTPLYTTQVATRTELRALLREFRLSLDLSTSTFRQWWMSSWKAPAKIILKQLRRRGILMTRSKSQPLLWNIVALIDQAFKRPPLCFAQADVTEPIWNADMVDVFADMAAEVFVQEALQHLKTADDVYLTATIANKLNLQRLSIAMNKSEFVDRVVDKMTKSSKLIVATDAQKERIVVLAPSEDHSLAYDADDVSSRLEDDGVEPQFEDKHANYAHGEHELRKQTTTWADNDIDRCEQVFKQKNAIFTSSRQVHGLEHNVQQCVALAAAILDRNGYYSASDMLLWIKMLTREQRGGISPDKILDLVVQSLQPFAIVLPGTPMMFWKKRELCAVQNGQSLDSTAEEWIEWYIQKVEKQISNTRVALAKVCLAGNLEGIVKAKCKIERRPFYKKLAKEVQVAQMILDALERNQDDTTTASVADSSSSSTSGQSKAKDGNKLISDDGNVLDREPLARSSLQQLKLDYPRKESASPEKLPWRYSNSSKTATERGYHEVENRLYKTVICYRWRNDGVCYFGNRCHYAHGEWELRPKSGNAQYNRRNPSFPDQNRSTANDSWRNRSFEMHEAKSSNGVSMATYFKASSPAQHETDSSTVE